ncbi:MAG: response regulator [Anaerolineae bacterium]|nr:response regulator [Anaerolineae bacterium]
MNPSVLVIDDELVTRRVVMHTLKSIQIDVVDAVNAAHALEIARDHHFNLMLVDINLPDMDGFTLINHLKQFEHLRDTPAIVFTARNNPNDDLRTAEVGAVDLLYKPFSTQELRDRVLRNMTINE